MELRREELQWGPWRCRVPSLSLSPLLPSPLPLGTCFKEEEAGGKRERDKTSFCFFNGFVGFFLRGFPRLIKRGKLLGS